MAKVNNRVYITDPVMRNKGMTFEMLVASLLENLPKNAVPTRVVIYCYIGTKTEVGITEIISGTYGVLPVRYYYTTDSKLVGSVVVNYKVGKAEGEVSEVDENTLETI